MSKSKTNKHKQQTKAVSKTVYGKSIKRVCDPWVSPEEIANDQEIQNKAKDIKSILFNKEKR